MIDRVFHNHSFNLCFPCTVTASHQTVRAASMAVGALLWRIQPFPFSQWLHPVTRCIFTPCLVVVLVCMCVFVCVRASFWAIWCSPDLHWWEQGKTSGCRHWQPLLITLTTGPEWHHHRAVTVIWAGRQTDMNRIKEKSAERWFLEKSWNV